MNNELRESQELVLQNINDLLEKLKSNKYSTKVELRNSRDYAEALSNIFDNAFLLKMWLSECTSVEQCLHVLHEYSNHTTWTMVKDTEKYTIFKTNDGFRDIKYLTVYKEV